MLSATPNARPVIGLVADPSSRSSRSDTAAQPTGAADQDAGMMPSPSCSLCKPSLPLGAMHCRIISATPPPPTLYRPSPISISTSWPQLCRHAATDETDSPAASDNHQRQSAPHNPLANVNQKRQSCSPSVVADSIQIDALPTLIVALQPWSARSPAFSLSGTVISLEPLQPQLTVSGCPWWLAGEARRGSRRR